MFLLISVCAISIIRIIKLVSPGHLDPTYSLTSVFIWTSVEPSVGIISACLPIMRKSPHPATLALSHVVHDPQFSIPPSTYHVQFPNNTATDKAPGPLFGRYLFAPVPSKSKLNKTPSPKKTTSSSQPTTASLASPVKGGFTRLEGPTHRDQLEASYRDRLEMWKSKNEPVFAAGGPVASGSYGDEGGTSWFMYGPGEGDARFEEGRGLEEGVQMREWPMARRASGDSGRVFG